MGVSSLFQLQWCKNRNKMKMERKQNIDESLKQNTKAFSSFVTTNGVFTASYS